jgi:hypothetical protein
VFNGGKGRFGFGDAFGGRDDRRRRRIMIDGGRERGAATFGISSWALRGTTGQQLGDYGQNCLGTGWSQCSVVDFLFFIRLLLLSFHFLFGWAGLKTSTGLSVEFGYVQLTGSSWLILDLHRRGRGL